MSDINETLTAPVTEADSETLRLAALLSDSPVPVPCTDDELADVDFSLLNVLIGTVRSDAQFDYCLSSNTYYIPAKTVTPNDLLPTTIALYEEGLTRRSGIKRYGRVTETRVVKRSDIPVPMSRPNPDEAYYLFSVDGWTYLEHPIAIQDTARGKPMFTSEFLLTHCRRSYQLLLIRSPEAYKLCRLLCDLSETEGSTPVFRRVGERHLISLSDGRFRLLDAAGHNLVDFPAAALGASPAEVLRGVCKALGV
ncbi:MAG: hypothetical protein IKU90_06260 [Clostridia bacterium]|nr:hypothetical protein [Clostridia bacterium]